MLKFLAIENIVLIKNAKINFAPNFCVLTGETGSGKSILLDSLGLVIGFRSNIRLIKNNENKSQVLAEFDISNNILCQNFLAENDLLNSENKNLLIIRRSIQESAQNTIINKIFVNDISIGVNLLAKIGELLVEIHGQHDQRGLLDEKEHIKILDEFSKNDEILSELKNTYEKLREVEKQLEEINHKKEQNLKDKDYFEHVINELENANILENEEQELVAKKDKIIAKEKITNFLNDLNNNLNEANLKLISSEKIIIRNNNLINNFLTNSAVNFDELSEKIDKQNDEISQIIQEVETLLRTTNEGYDNINEIEERLFLIKGLARKFSVSSDKLPSVIIDSQDKLNKIENDFTEENNLKEQLQNFTKKYYELSDNLNIRRKENALILAKKVENELQFLKMADAKFLINVEDRIEENDKIISINGYNKVRFLASLNKNNFDNIAKIASGGELSRFMLALKVALMNVKSVPTIIFDEIDTGIGGNTADAVGKRLKTLSQNVQILVVTHQPQIASKANFHLKVSKNSEGDETLTKIENLEELQRKIEIARMLSGEEISNEALMVAEKMLSN